jgi:hypothetical protein
VRARARMVVGFMVVGVVWCGWRVLGSVMWKCNYMKVFQICWRRKLVLQVI